MTPFGAVIVVEPTVIVLPLSVMCWVPVSSKPPFWATVLRLVFEGGIVRIGAFVTFVPLKLGTLLQSSCQPGLFADISIESAANRPNVGVPHTANSSFVCMGPWKLSPVMKSGSWQLVLLREFAVSTTTWFGRPSR